jgi:hypothetical protein
VLLPVPIDDDFVPYAKRPVLRRNQDLFVDGGRGGGGVAPAAYVSPAGGFCRVDRDCRQNEICYGGICWPAPGYHHR